MNPQDINARFSHAYNTHDLDAMLALYEDDATLLFGGGDPLRGSAAIRSALADFIQLGGELLYRPRFCVVAGDLALLSIDFELKGGKAPDGARVDMQGATVELVRRQPDGAWKYVIDHPFGALAPRESQYASQT